MSPRPPKSGRRSSVPPGEHSHRRRTPEHQRRATQAPRSVCQFSSREDAARTEYINTLEGGGGGEETVTEIVPTLVGLQGYRMHAARVGIGTVPTRNVTVTTIDEAGE